MSEWIKCSECLPEPGKSVLTYSAEEREGRVRIGHYVSGNRLLCIDPGWFEEFFCHEHEGNFGYRKIKVTHWRPLPESPKD
jgi:hypothetical protein